MEKIEIESPTRVDLAGGTLDCWPLYAFIGDCRTLNISIDIYTKVNLQARSDDAISVKMKNLNYEKTFLSKQDFLESKDPELFLVQKAYSFFPLKDSGFSLESFSQSPVGGGLGGSSSLLVSLLKAFIQGVNQSIEPEKIIVLAKNIEAQMLKMPTGTQDYYPAVHQGLNSLYYRASGVEHEVLDYDSEYFNSRMSLIYTGQPHHSGINNWSVIQNAVHQKNSTLEILERLNVVAHRAYEVCRSKNWEYLGEIFRQETELRIQLSNSFVSPEIQRLKVISSEAGAEALKICGAGGGGCVMIWSLPEKKRDVEEICIKNNFQILSAKALSS